MTFAEDIKLGMGIPQAALESYYSPQLNQLNMLQQQAKLEQLQGLDPVSQQNIASSQANIVQGQEKLDLARQQEQRLSEAQQAEMQQQQSQLLGAISYAGMKIQDPGQREAFFRNSAQLMGVPMDVVTPENIEASARIYEQSLSQGQNVRRSEILEDGTVIAVTDRGQKVYSPDGKLLSGQAAAEQIEKANQYKLNQSLETARMGTRGKAEEERRQEIMSGAYKAKSTIPTINNMLSLLDTVETSGFDAAQKKFTDFFGTTPRDVGQFDALAKSLVLQNLRALGSNPTEGERAFIESTSASLSQGGEVNKAILEQMKEIAERQIKQGRFIAGGGDPEQLLGEQPEPTQKETTETKQELPKIGEEYMPGVKRIK